MGAAGALVLPTPHVSPANVLLLCAQPERRATVSQADCKSVVFDCVGSTPTLSTNLTDLYFRQLYEDRMALDHAIPMGNIEYVRQCRAKLRATHVRLKDAWGF